MKNYLIIIACVSIICFAFLSCERDDYVPKQKSYPKIDFPERVGFEIYDQNGCKYSFEYPTYAEIIQDTIFFDENISNQCWADISFPSFNGKIHLSYKEIGKDITLDKVMEDSHELVYTHTQKADYIDEFEIMNPKGVQGKMFEVGGDAATNMQFYLTDYQKHYLRGSLYFESVPNADSLAPIVAFVQEDLLHLFDTFEWKE